MKRVLQVFLVPILFAPILLNAYSLTWSEPEPLTDAPPSDVHPIPLNDGEGGSWVIIHNTDCWNSDEYYKKCVEREQKRVEGGDTKPLEEALDDLQNKIGRVEDELKLVEEFKEKIII